MDPTVKIENNYSPTSHCAKCKLTEMLLSYNCVLTYCYVTMDREITFEVYSKTHKAIPPFLCSFSVECVF